MTVQLDNDFYGRLRSIRWLNACGSPDRPILGREISWVEDRITALSLVKSDLWQDAKTEAQGDLTGYLAKHHYSDYGGQWNMLAKQSKALLERDLSQPLAEGLQKAGISEDLKAIVLVDLNRAALETAYRRKFPKAPMFFEQLVALYESGRLPCGWDGVMDNWPRGRIIAF
jgi:hypothetical protein